MTGYAPGTLPSAKLGSNAPFWASLAEETETPPVVGWTGPGLVCELESERAGAGSVRAKAAVVVERAHSWEGVPGSVVS